MIKLTQLIKESSEEKRPLSNEVKKHFLEIVSTYNKYQESLDRKSDLQEIAETLGGITEAARTLAIHEGDDWFDKHTVKRNMSELDKLGKQFDKCAVEAKGLDQRMAGLYEDMGHILSRYYKMGEITEDQMKERLGMTNESVKVNEGTDIYIKNKIQITKFSGGKDGKLVQINAPKLKGAGDHIVMKIDDFQKMLKNSSKLLKQVQESVKESKSDCGCGCGGVTEGGCNG